MVLDTFRMTCFTNVLLILVVTLAALCELIGDCKFVGEC